MWMRTMDSIIELDSLTRTFGSFVAVDGVDLSIAGGEIFGLLGPNGAGKTTVIKMLTTLLPPSRGTARVAGWDIRTQGSRVRNEIAYVPQLVSVDGTLTGAENLRLFAKLYGVPSQETEARVAGALRFAGLEEYQGRIVRGYSGGMVRRLEIAMALIHRPRVLFLDEPTVGLDPVARQSVWHQVRALVEEVGLTVVLTTHFMEEAESLCGRVAIMKQGRVVATGSPDELKASIGAEHGTLDEVFARYSGATSEVVGNLRDVAKSRRTMARLG